MNKLLKDAIADAKAVRETALANAKLALSEAFAPKLQSMLSSKIREEMEEEEPVEDENVDTNAEMYGADNDAQQGRMKELAGISEEGDEDYSDEDEGNDDVSGEEDFSDEGGEDYSDEDGDESYDDEPSDEDDEDLEEILRELEAEDGEKEEESESTMMEDFDLDEVIASLREEEGSNEEEKEEEQMDEEIDLNELLASLEEDTENYKEADDQAMDTPGSQHGRKNTGGAPDAEEDETPADNVNEMSKMKMKKKMKKMEEEINEAYSAVKFLRTKLSEVNLLNAKLLYVNKLFRNNLTEAQKVKVIENFDRAKTVREAKLVYATLSESLKAAKSSETKTTKKSVMEGFASKATKKTTSVLTEGNDQINRFKKLAGII